MHIGLIGGIGPAATEFYYRHLVRAHAARGRSMELTIAHAQVRDLLQNMNDGAPERQAQIFGHLARRLQAAGAEAVAVTSMAGHFCIREFQALSPLPVISAIPELEAELVRRRVRCVGLLGTRIVMTSRLYGGLSAFDVVLPRGEELEVAHQDYIAMATVGQASGDQRERLFSIGRALCREQGAEVVVLAGTDLFLAFEGRACDFPTIDSALVHVDALVRASTRRPAEPLG